jgi:miniconductance mechanosensitive channel
MVDASATLLLASSGLRHNLESWLTQLSVPGDVKLIASHIIGLGTLLLIAIGTYIFVKAVIFVLQRTIGPRLPADSLLRLTVNHRVFVERPRLFPVIAVLLANPLVFSNDPSMRRLVDGIAGVLLSIIVCLMLARLLDAIHEHYRRDKEFGHRALKNLIQAAKVLVALCGALAALAFLFDKSPLLVLSGFGAATAVFLLVFKDPILGLVAGVQLNVNNMIRIGDWIQMPDGTANGTVTDIALTTVTVQNFDNTDSYIPSYDLIKQPFINWRGMTKSGGRRIKRHLLLDLESIRFADDRMIAELDGITLLAPYLEKRRREIEEFNASFTGDSSHPANGRRLTNAGLFRAYIAAYLQFRQDIQSEGFTFLVRHLQPTNEGLPIEVYVFTTTTDWAEYEGIQADIFDHLIAVLPVFGLRPFQSPSGPDLRTAITQLMPTASPTTSSGQRP